MVHKLVSAAVSASLCLAPVSPAFSRDYTDTQLDAPRGATGTINLRMPLGATAERAEPTYGLSFTFGQPNGADDTGRSLTRDIRVADLRFGTDGEVRHARLTGFDLAHLDQDKRLNLMNGEDNTLWIVVGLVAAGVAVCLLADCFEGDDDDDSSSSSR